ncbi:speckle-type POZ protein-like [Aphidius gifuensis]|uniref:speckle-type POZ protein-like n=1 Tax=Aphidius gifuensis TaxID=684658 RepID=UPI001CDD6B71|nr:speckle-type POZ protein-like [Aphidius gifuensis]
MSTITKQSTQICQGLDTRVDIYLWKIKNFNSICTQNLEKIIISPIFGQSEGLWRIGLSPISNGTVFTIGADVSNKKDFSQTSFEITVINKNSSTSIQTKEIKIRPCQVKNKASYFCSVLDKNLFEFAKLNPSSWLTDDVLTISIKLVTVLKSLPPQINRPLISGLLSWLQNEKFSDIVLEVDGKDLKAHKMILSIKSPVFSAMFDYESMKESRDNRVVIKDIDADVVEQMLEYIYTEKTPSKIDDCVYDLIGAADKYQIDDLKEICENNLMGKITVDNAVDTLIVADRYDTKKLKNKVIEFIKQNLSIVNSADFKNLQLQDANLAFEILRKLILEK